MVERATHGAVAALDAAEPERGPPREALERLIAASWSEATRHLSAGRAAAEQLSADAMRRAHEPIAARVRALVERGREAGDFRADVPVEWLVATTLRSPTPPPTRCAQGVWMRTPPPRPDPHPSRSDRVPALAEVPVPRRRATATPNSGGSTCSSKARTQ